MYSRIVDIDMVPQRIIQNSPKTQPTNILKILKNPYWENSINSMKTN